MAILMMGAGLGLHTRVSARNLGFDIVIRVVLKISVKNVFLLSNEIEMEPWYYIYPKNLEKLLKAGFFSPFYILKPFQNLWKTSV